MRQSNDAEVVEVGVGILGLPMSDGDGDDFACGSRLPLPQQHHSNNTKSKYFVALGRVSTAILTSRRSR